MTAETRPVQLDFFDEPSSLSSPLLMPSPSPSFPHIPLVHSAFTPSSDQETALRAFVSWWHNPSPSQNPKLFRLGGYAGTGKTRLLPHLIEAIGLAPQNPREIETIKKCVRDFIPPSPDLGGGVLFCAPTGRASLVMKEKFAQAGLSWPTSTIHAALYAPNTIPDHDELHKKMLAEEPDEIREKITSGSDLDLLAQFTAKVHRCWSDLIDDPSFSVRETAPAQYADLIVIDEGSMVDPIVTKDLLALKARILAIGDPGQLPPVHEGKGSLFPTNVQPDALLSEIHRQAADNPIITLSAAIRAGQILSPTHSLDGRVFILPSSYARQIENFTPPRDQFFNQTIICGRNNTRHLINQRIRKTLGFNSDFPELGEILITLKNRYKKKMLHIANGQLWECGPETPTFATRTNPDRTLDWLLNLALTDPYNSDEDPKFVEVLTKIFQESRLGGVTVPYPDRSRTGALKPDTFLTADWGYGITCHKAQGSSWHHVTVFDESSVFRAHKTRWLYTAVTRAEETLTIVLGS